MRPRKRDFRGDARKGAKNYDTVSSDDSEVYRRKDPFAGRNRKRPSGRRAQLNICNPSPRFGLLILAHLASSLKICFISVSDSLHTTGQKASSKGLKTYLFSPRAGKAPSEQG